MDQPLHQHIAQLEKKIVILRRELRDSELSDFEKAERELALANAEEALNLFRKAYEIEQQV